MKKLLALVGVSVLATQVAQVGAAQAEIRRDAIKIGILGDMTGIYSGNGGTGSVVAAGLAAEEFGGAIHGKPIVILQADDQNKADIGAGIAREWFDRAGVLAVADLVPSAVALAVEDLVRQDHRIALISGAAAESMFQENCAATAFTWTQDTYSIANGVVGGVWARTHAPWFFVNVDLAPSLQLQRQAGARLKELGGTVAGSMNAPSNTDDYSSFLLAAQASGAGVLAINTLGNTNSTVKQAVEFGLSSAMTMVVTTPKSQDFIAMGLPTAAGQLVVTSFYEDVSPQARAWTDRYMARTHKLPTEVQAGVYSSVRHLLQAVKDSDSDDGEIVAAKMRATPVSDAFTRHGEIRADGRMVHDMYLMRIKSPAQSKDARTDIWEKVATIPAAEAFPPLASSRCPLAHVTQ
jgi:ABC-type branched-subunit amino acid transport system substrate-binding protein